MNGFQLHNQLHTSASSINSWAAAPDIWVAEKLFGVKQPGSAAMHRGNAVESALVNILAYGVDHEEAIRQAIETFNAKTALLGDPKADDERNAISAYVEQGVAALAEFGSPYFEADGKQNRIELLCRGDGWELPVIGYTDLNYPVHGLIIDVKTTGRAPSEMSAEHNRQAAIYRKASGNAQVKFLYLTPKKAVWHECLDVDGTLAEIKQILTEQELFLRNTTREELAAWHAVHSKMFPGGRKRFNF